MLRDVTMLDGMANGIDITGDYVNGTMYASRWR